MKRLLLELETIVRQIGEELKIRRLDFLGGEKWIGAEVKSRADEFAHKRISFELEKITPGIPILSEERDYSSFEIERPKQYWLIDPIDGTSSFVNGFTGWVIQVCLVSNNQPYLAVIYAPDLDIFYSCELGKGAWINGRHICEIQKSDRSLVLTDNYPEPRGIAKYIVHSLSNISYLESGSLSLKAMYVLSGKADIFIKDVVVRDWDFGPPIAFSRLWGGIITELDGKKFALTKNITKRGIIVTRNREIHNEIVRIANKWLYQHAI